MKYHSNILFFVLIGMTYVKFCKATSNQSSSLSSSSTTTSATISTVTTTTESKVNQILSKIKQWQRYHSKFQHTLPFVTITYAQTLDGMIAITTTKTKEEEEDLQIDDDNKKKVSSNLQLSNQDSFQLTHALRSIHDGIIVGGNTLRHDNPRLNNRLWNDNDTKKEEEHHQIHQHQPIPIILDTNLNHIRSMIKTKTKIKCVSTHDKVIICCNEDAYKTYKDVIDCEYPCHTIHLLPCQMNEQHFELQNQEGGDDNNDTEQEFQDIGSGGLNLQNLLFKLRVEHDIKSIMVEGGSSILSSFIQSNTQHEFVDCVCITVVPKMIGGKNGLLALNRKCDLIHYGTGVGEEGEGLQPRGLEYDPKHVSWYTLGCDCIFLASCLMK